MYELLLQIAGQLGAGAIEKVLSGAGLANTDIRDALIGVTSWVAALISWLQQLLGNEVKTWEQASGDVKLAAFALGETAYADQAAWTRLLTVILPGSQSWMDGRTHQWVHQYVDPFMTQMQRDWRSQWQWNAAQQTWERTYVTPNIEEWRSWHRWWQGWPYQTVATVRGWLEQPSRFAQWATPILTPSIVRWLGYADRGLYRDELTAEILAGSQDMPKLVERATVAFLTSEGW